MATFVQPTHQNFSQVPILPKKGQKMLFLRQKNFWGKKIFEAKKFLRGHKLGGWVPMVTRAGQDISSILNITQKNFGDHQTKIEKKFEKTDPPLRAL